MNQAPNVNSGKAISRRHLCSLFVRAGMASALTTLPLRELAQRSTASITGKDVPALRDFDALLFDYLKRNKSIPGASLAIARDGRIITPADSDALTWTLVKQFSQILSFASPV